MSPTSYQTALPRDQFRVLLFLCPVIGQLLPLPFDELLPIAIGTLPRDQFLIALYYSTAASPISRG